MNHDDPRVVNPLSDRCGQDQSYAYIDANVESLPSDEKNAYIAAGKALSFFAKMEGVGSCGLERGSVYGAAVAIPQIARSAGYSRTMTSLAVRSYLFLCINIAMQFFLLSMIGQESHVMQGYAGQPHLCDFGKSMQRCPDDSNCWGPGGTTFEYARLYDFDAWMTRTFVRDSLKKVFPERSDDIHRLADPGEYGLENYYCRLVCCFIYMMAVMEDLRSSVNLVFLLTHIPNAPERWIRYEQPTWGSKTHIKLVREWRELDLVRFGVAGMPFAWKLMNFGFVVIPKMGIWFLLTISGNYFLMETAGIIDLIMNSVALTFILSLDEMVFTVFTTTAVKHMMGNMEDYDLFTVDEEEKESDDEALHRFCREEFGPSSWGRFFRQLNPKRLWYVLILMLIFTVPYYYMYCHKEEDGSWISDPIHPPERIGNNPLALILPLKAFGWEQQVDAVWSMPEHDHFE